MKRKKIISVLVFQGKGEDRNADCGGRPASIGRRRRLQRDDMESMETSKTGKTQRGKGEKRPVRTTFEEALSSSTQWKEEDLASGKEGIRRESNGEGGGTFREGGK